MVTRNKRRIVASSSAQMLPDEMLTEVFLRLPVKSILRFRAVCRSWAAMLSSEEFCDLHMAKAKAASVPKIYFTKRTGFDARSVSLCSSSGPDIDLLFTLDAVNDDSVDMTPAPCRGLTLLYDKLGEAYYVFNAATRAVTRLPPCQYVSSATAGLGFEAQTKEYKVVRLCIGNYLEPYIKCDIYNLGGENGHCWRPAIHGVPFRFCRAAHSAVAHSIEEKLPPVFAGGFLHWLLDPLSTVIRPRAGILCFSITDETFRLIQSPPFVPPGGRFEVLNNIGLVMFREREVLGLHLVELAGQLCMLRDLRNALRDCSMLEIWRLNDYSSGGWSLLHRIDLLQHVARDLREASVVKVIGSIGNCISKKKVVIVTSKYKVIVYDPVFESLETVLAVRETHSAYQTEQSDLRISLCQESLVPVPKTEEEIV